MYFLKAKINSKIYIFEGKNKKDIKKSLIKKLKSLNEKRVLFLASNIFLIKDQKNSELEEILTYFK
tara:strand:+ start:21573 stop:21770 length:198 start_codon:yes stop_codon:yes gene_type:complete